MTDADRENFVKELLQNLPEYSISFDCLSWDYNRCRFSLRDNEDGTNYYLTIEKALTGFKKLCNEIDAGKLHFCGMGPDYKVDACQWDALSIDALLQMSVLGEVIYG